MDPVESFLELLRPSVKILIEEIRAQTRIDVAAEISGGQRQPTARKVAAKRAPSKRAKRGGGYAAGGDMDGLIKKIVDYVKKNPDSSLSTIATGLKMTPTQLQWPMKKIRAKKLLRLSGTKQAATYTAP